MKKFTNIIFAVVLNLVVTEVLKNNPMFKYEINSILKYFK